MRDRPDGPAHVRYRRRHGVVWPVILIGAGIIFLLQNFGILSWNAWGSLWQFWPLILILIGLELFLGGAVRSAFGGLIIGLIAIVVIGVAVAGTLIAGRAPDSPLARFQNAGPTVSNTIGQALQDAKQANVSLQFGAGNLSVGALDGATEQLARTTYSGPEGLQPRSTYNVSNGTGRLMLGYAKGSRGFRPPFFGGDANTQMDVLLNPEVPLALNIQEGASTSRIDLTKLRVTNLELQTGASQTTLLLPSGAGTTTAVIKSGAATLDIQVPSGVAAQIQYNGGLSTLNVDQGRFPSAGDRVYRSADYASAPNKVDLTIQAGVATVNVH